MTINHPFTHPIYIAARKEYLINRLINLKQAFPQLCCLKFSFKVDNFQSSARKEKITGF